MDKVVEIIVRLIAALGGWAPFLYGDAYVRPSSEGQRLKVLLAGYNGARNTGSDVRVAALADQLLTTFGEGAVELSVMSLDPTSTDVYFRDKACQIPFNTLFFAPLFEACSKSHVVILCEGSTFKSKFADALTLYSCEAAGVARSQGKPCIAYGGEVGEMKPFLERAVRDLCGDVLFIARSEASYDAARLLGLEARLGTDTAWTFDSSQGAVEARRLLQEGGWDGKRPLLGIAPVNPYWWPVRPSLMKWLAAALGDDRYRQFQKWYFFSWDEERACRYRRYLDDLAAATRTFARERGYHPVVIGMEKLDADACNELAVRLGGEVPIFLSRDHDGYVISEVLRSLSLLVTSRYHAQVLATDAAVPTVAVSMDERLDNLAVELGLPPELLLHVDDADLAPRLLLSLDYAADNRDYVSGQLERSKSDLESRLGDMSIWFSQHVWA